MAELKKPYPSEMSPPGYHVVRSHERVCHLGTVTWVDAHIRKNQDKIKSGLLVENIQYLYWQSKKNILHSHELKITARAMNMTPLFNSGWIIGRNKACSFQKTSTR